MAEMPWENAPFTATKVKAEEVFGVNPSEMPRPYYDEYVPARKILEDSKVFIGVSHLLD